MDKDIRTKLEEANEKNYPRVRQEMLAMLSIEERAHVYALEHFPYSPYYEETFEEYKLIAEEQKAIDHSEEHLNWIIKQYHLWSYEMCHCDNNECCTFKEWIDKAMEG